MEENRNRANWFLDGIRLEDLYFVGLYEQLDGDIEKLAKLLTWPQTNELPHRKSSSGFIGDNDCTTQYNAIDTRMRKEIADLNSLDIAMYAEAHKLRKNA